jgi:hypothetical protein
MRVAAAEFHEAVTAFRIHFPGNGGGQLSRNLAVAEFGYVFHQ